MSGGSQPDQLGSPGEVPDRAPSGAVHARPGATVKFKSGGEVASAARAKNLYAAGAARLAEGDALAAQAEAEGKEARVQAKKLEDWSQGIRQLEDEALASSMRNAQNVQKLGQMVGSFRPRPGRLFQDASAAASWGAAMSLAASTFQSARSGGANGAMQIIQAAIQQDLAAQELIYDAKKTELQSAQTLYTQMRASYGDAIVARQAQRAALLEAAKQRIAAAGAPAKGEAQRQEKIALGMELNAKGNQTLIDMAQKEYTLTTYARAKELGPALLKLLPRDLQMKLLENSGQADLATLYGISSDAAKELIAQAGMSEEKAAALKAAVDADAKSLDAVLKNGATSGGTDSNQGATDSNQGDPNQGGSNPGGNRGGRRDRRQGSNRGAGAAPVDVVDTTDTTDVQVGPDGDVMEESSESLTVTPEQRAAAEQAREQLPGALGDQSAEQANLRAAKQALVDAKAAVAAADADLESLQGSGLSRTELARRITLASVAKREAKAAVEAATANLKDAEALAGTADDEVRQLSEADRTVREADDAQAIADDDANEARLDEEGLATRPDGGRDAITKDLNQLKATTGNTRADKGAYAEALDRLVEDNERGPGVVSAVDSLLPRNTGGRGRVSWSNPLEQGDSSATAKSKLRQVDMVIKALGGAINLDPARGPAYRRLLERATVLGDHATLQGLANTEGAEHRQKFKAITNVVDSGMVKIAFVRELTPDGKIKKDRDQIQALLAAGDVPGVRLQEGWMDRTVEVPAYITDDGGKLVRNGTEKQKIRVPVYWVTAVKPKEPPKEDQYQFGHVSDTKEHEAGRNFLDGGKLYYKASLPKESRADFMKMQDAAGKLGSISKRLLLGAALQQAAHSQGMLSQAFGEATLSQVELDAKGLQAAWREVTRIPQLKEGLAKLTQAERDDVEEALMTGQPQKSKLLRGLMRRDGDEFIVQLDSIGGIAGTVSHFYGFMAPQKAEMEIVQGATGLRKATAYNPVSLLRRGTIAQGNLAAPGFVDDLNARLRSVYDAYTRGAADADSVYRATLTAMSKGQPAPSINSIRGDR